MHKTKIKTHVKRNKEKGSTCAFPALYRNRSKVIPQNSSTHKMFWCKITCFCLQSQNVQALMGNQNIYFILQTKREPDMQDAGFPSG